MPETFFSPNCHRPTPNGHLECVFEGRMCRIVLTEQEKPFLDTSTLILNSQEREIKKKRKKKPSRENHSRTITQTGLPLFLLHYTILLLKKKKRCE
jgi:hypothetical protein